MNLFSGLSTYIYKNCSISQNKYSINTLVTYEYLPIHILILIISKNNSLL